MGQITDTKAGTRGCQFNNRFTLQYIQAVNVVGISDLGCVNGTGSPDGKFRKTKNISANLNNTSSGSMGPFGTECNGTWFPGYCCYGTNSYSYTSSWNENIEFVITPVGEFVIGNTWDGNYSIIRNFDITCCGPDCVTNCEPSEPFPPEIGFFIRKLNPDGTFTDESEGYFNQITKDISSEDCDSGSNSENTSTQDNCGSSSHTYNDNGATATDDPKSFILGGLRSSTAIKLKYLFDADAWEYYDELEDPPYIENLGEDVGSGYLLSQRVKFRFIKDDREDNSDLDIYIIKTEENYYIQFQLTELDENGDEVLVGDVIRILIGSTSSTFAGNQLYGNEVDFTNQDFQEENLIGQPVYGCLNIKSIKRL